MMDTQTASPDGASQRHINAEQAILEVRQLYKHFPVRQSLVDTLLHKPGKTVRAVDGVSLSIGRGKVLALVGESGSGKTTIARTLIGLEEPTGGDILFDGQLLDTPKRRARDGAKTPARITLKRLRLRAQMIFQDPYESLNPRATIFEIVAEPLEVHGIAKDPQEREKRVTTALEEAGLRLAADYFLRYPHELSGGQRQRVVIAAAMALEPELLLADEPVSMLDVSIRAEILNLLRELQKRRGVSILFITHDMGTVAYFADYLAVMYLGRIVESGETFQVLRNPRHPYTQALLSVVPVPNPRLRRQRMILQGETPNPVDIPGGCRFHPRCPLAAERCRQVDPAMVSVEPGHQAACLLVG
jgi:oligopeptide/dipeptide ABC transporter ATP-binding protein